MLVYATKSLKANVTVLYPFFVFYSELTKGAPLVFLVMSLFFFCNFLDLQPDRVERRTVKAKMRLKVNNGLPQTYIL